MKTELGQARATLWLVGAAMASLIAGIALSHVIEPGVRVEYVTLAGDTPAIRLVSKTPGPHPVALLAHGVTASKETLFRFGEALAAAGFDCFAIDLPGHGASRQPFSLRAVGPATGRVADAIGPVDVFLGHSMGAGAGAWCVREAGLLPKVFIAVGADPIFANGKPPLVLLAGWFEEFVRPAQLREQVDARVVISPWSDHVLEPFDPFLVNAAVKAACDGIGRTPPHAPTAWLWRIAGLVLGVCGALVLVLYLPDLHPRFAHARGIGAPVVVILVLVFITGTWGGAMPHLHRIPIQLVYTLGILAALIGIRKLHIPRWSLPVFAAILMPVYLITASLVNGFPVILVPILAMSLLLLIAGTVFGCIVAHRGSRRDSDIAMALFAGYAIGQFIPQYF